MVVKKPRPCEVCDWGIRLEPTHALNTKWGWAMGCCFPCEGGKSHA